MNKVKRIKSSLLYGVLFLYIIIMSYILFFKMVSPLQLFSVNRMYFRNVNIIPFHSIISYLSIFVDVSSTVALNNLIGNIVIFIPLGIYLTLLKKDKRLSINIFLVFLISLFIEIIQFIFGLGISDIDDVILNCLGGLIGVLIYNGLALKCKNEDTVRSIIIMSSTVVGAFILFIAILLIL